MKISSTKKSHRVISVLLAFTMVIGGVICDRSSSNVYAYGASDAVGRVSLSGDPENLTVSNGGNDASAVIVLDGVDLYCVDNNYEEVVKHDDVVSVTVGDNVTLLQSGVTSTNITINGGIAILDGRVVGEIINQTASSTCTINDNVVADVTNYGKMTITSAGMVEGNVDNGGTLSFGNSNVINIPSGDTFHNNGVINCTTFDGSSFGNRFTNLGTIKGNNITISSGNITSEDNSKYQILGATDTLSIGKGGIIGHVEANPEATISVPSSDDFSDVYFYLTVGEKADSFTYMSQGQSYKAGYLIKDYPDIDWVGDFPDPLFYGMDYDVTNNITTDSTGEMTIKYSDMYGDYQTTPTSVKPTAVGEHRVQVYLTETDTHKDVDEYGLKDYWIRYLTEDYDETMGASLEADLINDGGYYYTNKPYKIVANSGFQVSFYSFSPDEPNSEFADTYTVKKDGYYNGTMAALRRKSDKATSDYDFIDSKAIYLDQKAPEVDAASVVDQDGNTPATAVEDGAEIHASKLEFDIKDVWGSSETIYYTALNSVTVNGESVDVDWSTNSAHVVLSTPKARKTYNIVAKDKVGNVNEFSITIENLDKAETSVSMPDAYYGAVLPLPTVTTNSDQSTDNYEYLYKKKGASDDAYSTVKPTAIGDYTVKVNVPYSYNYSASSAESDFSIGYLPAPEIPYTILGAAGNNGYYKSDVTIVAPDDYTISSSTDESSFGASVAYSSSLKSVYLKRKADCARTNAVEIPSILVDKDAPAFSELAMDQEGVAHTLADGLGVNTTGLGFSVSDANLTSVSVNGEAAEIADGKSEVVLNIDPGTQKTFNVVAEDIAGNVSSVSVTLNGMPADTTEEATDKVEPTLTVTLDDQYYGVDYDPAASTDSNGAEGITFSFRKDVEGSAYEDVKPVEPGDYVVKAILPETDHFQGKEVEKKFSISYLPAPTDAYSLSGTEGKNDYYTTDVELVAKDGYKISNRLNGTYDTSVTYTEGMGYVYLKRNSDNAKTTAIKISQEIKVDKVKPALGTFGKDQDGKVVDLTSSFYADTVTFSIYDEHLDTVYLDDTEITVKDGTATITIDAEGGKKGCTVTATDEAGNVYGLRITMMASWMFTNVVPVGSVQLETGNAYKFGSGHYKVNSDSTLYNGGGSFYVLKSGKFEIVSVD